MGTPAASRMPLTRCAMDVNAPTGIWICVSFRNTGRGERIVDCFWLNRLEGSAVTGFAPG
jgi:hypothetical protein